MGSQQLLQTGRLRKTAWSRHLPLPSILSSLEVSRPHSLPVETNVFLRSHTRILFFLGFFYAVFYKRTHWNEAPSSNFHPTRCVHLQLNQQRALQLTLGLHKGHTTGWLPRLKEHEPSWLTVPHISGGAINTITYCGFEEQHLNRFTDLHYLRAAAHQFETDWSPSAVYLALGLLISAAVKPLDQNTTIPYKFEAFT